METLGFDGQGTVHVNMISYKTGKPDEMGITQPDDAYFGTVLRKCRNYQVWQRRPTRAEFEKAFPRRKT